jgi:hypothetical protein
METDKQELINYGILGIFLIIFVIYLLLSRIRRLIKYYRINKSSLGQVLFGYDYGALCYNDIHCASNICKNNYCSE